MNNLDGFATNNFKGRAPDVMPSNNFKQAPLQRRQIERAVPVYSHSLVVERNVTCHLPMKPYLLLSERKRYWYPVWTRTDQSPLRSRFPDSAAQVFLKKLALRFRKWGRVRHCVAFPSMDHCRCHGRVGINVRSLFSSRKPTVVGVRVQQPIQAVPRSYSTFPGARLTRVLGQKENSVRRVASRASRIRSQAFSGNAAASGKSFRFQKGPGYIARGTSFAPGHR